MAFGSAGAVASKRRKGQCRVEAQNERADAESEAIMGQEEEEDEEPERKEEDEEPERKEEDC